MSVKRGTTVVVWLALLVVSGCAGVSEVPPVDLSQPGWEVWTGQVIWSPAGADDGIAGELIAARHEDGSTLVVMSKPPVPIFSARHSEDRWLIAFADREHRGRGQPPSRFVWFWLPGMLSGEALPPDWSATRLDEDRWELGSERGDRIRLVLDP